MSWLTVLVPDPPWRAAMEPRCSVHGSLEVGREEGKEREKREREIGGGGRRKGDRKHIL